MLIPRRALRLSVLAAVLALPVCAASRIELRPAPERGLPWFAVVTSPSEGVCRTKVLRNLTGGAQLEMPREMGPGTAECPSRVIVFSGAHPPTVVEEPRFPGEGSPLPIKLRGLETVRVQAWLLICLGEKGAACRKGEDNSVLFDSQADLEYSLYQYSSSFAGIAVEALQVKDVHDRPDANRVEETLRTSGHQPECGAFAKALETAPALFASEALNVYYSSARSGLACTGVPDSPDPIRRAGFVIIPAGGQIDLLAHELGHMLLDEESHLGTDPSNLMDPNGGLSRCNLDLGQAYTIHQKQKYAQYRKADSPAPPPLPDAALCDSESGCDTASARLYPFACPQQVHRIVTDWIRCMHCGTEAPPKVDLSGTSKLLIPVVRMMLGGRLRVQDRIKMDGEVREKADVFAKRFGGLPRKEFADFYWDYLVKKHQLRAVEALQALDAPCDLQVHRDVIAALEWVLGQESSETTTGKLTPLAIETARNALEFHKSKLASKESSPAESCRDR